MDRYVTDIKNGCYQNPVLPMDFSDPDAIRVGEDYYLISSSFTYLPGVPVLHSKDLVHWERIGNCVERLPFDRYAQPAHGCGTWAPALRYHAGRFYAFIPLPDEGIFYTEATDPAGPWSALHCVKSASGWIDPCPLWDDDAACIWPTPLPKAAAALSTRSSFPAWIPKRWKWWRTAPSCLMAP